MRKFASIVTVLLLLGLPLSTHASASVQNNLPAGSVYYVKAGDTLSGIAIIKHTTVQSLIKTNNLANPNSLHIGQTLVIPGLPKQNSGSAPVISNPAPQTEKYTVKSGDTLSVIARAKGVSVNMIMEANKLTNPNKLSIGQALVIPTSQKNASVSRSDTGRHSAESNNQVSELIGYAKSLLGTPYSYSSAGPNSFDCSGFTMTVFDHIDIDLPHSSTSQSKKGESVKKADLTAGDLVFFNTSGNGISHVGIYIGDGSFIHASSGRGKVVIDPLSDKYYAARYVKAKRVL